MASGEYEAYVRDEWALFAGDPSRRSASLLATEGARVARVLDVGCGGAQELLPFVAGAGVFGVGIDLSPRVGLTWSGLTEGLGPASRVAFVRGSAEALPFPAASFDVVTCRLVLPYTHNRRALSEIARVLRPEGVLLLKYHHLRYYAERLSRGASARDWRAVGRALAVLAGGAVYHAIGWQGGKGITAEVFQTDRRLRRLLSACGLYVVRNLPDSNPRTPSHVIRRQAEAHEHMLGGRPRAARLLRRVVRRVVRSAVYSRDEVVVFLDTVAGASGRASVALPPEVEVRAGTFADLVEAAAAHPEYLDASRLARAQERLARGDRVYVVRCGGQVAHVNWAGLRSELTATEVGADVRIPLQPDAVVAYDAWTAQEFRSRGLFTASLRRILADATAIGCRCWCYCRIENRASRRVIEKNGFRPSHRMVRLRVFGRAWSRVIDAAGEV
jgi:hypothetical protein